MAKYPTLKELEPRVEELPSATFKYYRGHLTGAFVSFYPNARKWAQTMIRELKANPGDRSKWPVYLELLELIEQWENRKELTAKSLLT